MKTENKYPQTTKSAVGVSYHDTTITTTINELIRFCGDASFANPDEEEKCQYLWQFETTSGDVFTVYDIYQYRKLEFDEPIEFHVGGNTKAITELGKRLLIEAGLKEIHDTPTHIEEAETTEKPWRSHTASSQHIVRELEKYPGEVEFLCTVTGQNSKEISARRDFIVTAVNSHSSLVRRVEELERLLESAWGILQREKDVIRRGGGGDQTKLIEAINTALTKP